MEKILSFSEQFKRLSYENKRTIGYLGETKWFLCKDSFDNTIFLYFFRSDDTGRVKIEVKFCLGPFIILSKEMFLKNGQRLAIISIKIMNRLANPNNYIMKGTITIQDGSENVSDKEDSNSTNLKSGIAKNCCPFSKLSDDLLCMLDNPDSFTDATLKCGSASIQVHRGIISMRSPVFAAMFKTQMQEGRDGVVDIVDMDPDVLQAMLSYIYSGKTDDSTESLAGDLVFAADKYQLKELKLFCVEKLKSGMAAKNIFRSLVIGELIDRSLKEHAMDFICKFKTFSELEKTQEWKSLQAERPALAMEVVTSIVKYLQVK